MNSIRLLATLTVFAAGLTACGGDGDNDSSANQTSMPSGSNPPVAITAPAGFNGIWGTPCEEGTSDGANTTYATNQLQIQDDVHTTTISIFTDNACQIPAEQHKLVAVESVTYDGTTETALGTAFNVDRTPESVSYDGVAQNVDSETVYDIYLVSGNNLYVGSMDAVNTGETAASRPMELAQSSPFMRQ